MLGALKSIAENVSEGRLCRFEDIVFAEAFLTLEPEEVALLVLQDLVAQETHRGSGSPNRHNFSLGFRNHPEPVQRAIMEAWAWLETSGAIAELPQHQDGWFFVTRRGHELAQSSDTAVFTRGQTLPRHLLHPRIEQKVWSAFLRGEYDSAVFEAFKQVEVAIRDAGGFPHTDIGVPLARKAFHPDSGPLTDVNVVPAERQALSDLVAGAFGGTKKSTQSPYPLEPAAGPVFSVRSSPPAK